VRKCQEHQGSSVLHVLILQEAQQVTDVGLMELKELKSLKTLAYGGTQVTDAGVRELQAALPECRINP
jgi:hypothetical protein